MKLASFLPNKMPFHHADGEMGLAGMRESIGSMKAFYGNFLVVVSARCATSSCSAETD
jgi:glycine cleavage system protein P-like pyridoxal-binding family